MVTASDQPDFAERLQEIFTTRWLRIYTNPDVLGVELAGATKNVIAIAAGILDGLSSRLQRQERPARPWPGRDRPPGQRHGRE